jgi:hypothetical protein
VLAGTDYRYPSFLALLADSCDMGNLYLLAKRFAEAVFCCGGDAAQRRRRSFALARYREPVMQVFKGLIVTALLIGSLLLGILVASATAAGI